MKTIFVQQLKISILAMIVWTVITGALYPLAVTGAAQAFFPIQANGSLVGDCGLTGEGGTVRGSALIGQQFDSPAFFWGRLSATGPVPYNAAASSGSNLGPMNPALADAIKARVAALQSADTGNTQTIPIDLVTASGSGLDPHISPAAAYYQLGRVARARGWNAEQNANAMALIARMTAPRLLGLIGDEHVNVLSLNVAINRL